MREKQIRVAVVEDQPLYRDLLASSLAEVSDIDVVLSASTVREARTFIKPGTVDVALLDVELPDGNGIGLGASLKRNDPELKVVTLSVLDMLEPLLGLPDDIRQGWSYLSKGSTGTLETLVRTIRETAAGKSVIDPSLLLRSKPRTGSSIASLTNRQFEILRSVARGGSNETIAEELGIAPNSVVNHLTAIYSALGIPEGQNARVTATLEFLANTQRIA